MSGARETFFSRGVKIKNQVRQVVIAIALTPAQHKRHIMQFLTSAPNFRGQFTPLTRPSRVPAIYILNTNNMLISTPFTSNWKLPFYL